MTRIIILGGSGFVGSHLLKRLEHETFETKVMVNKHDIKTDAKRFYGNILSEKSLYNQIQKKDVIVNLIGQWDKDITKYVDLNILGGINILNSCIKKKIKRIILISSIDVYGESLHKASTESDCPKPDNTYAAIKNLTETMYHYCIV